MYTPLGAGDVDIAGIVTALRANGYDGWFVMEQDTILDGEPTDEGPVRDVRASVAFLRRSAARSWHERRLRSDRRYERLRIGVLGASRIAESRHRRPRTATGPPAGRCRRARSAAAPSSSPKSTVSSACCARTPT